MSLDKLCHNVLQTSLMWRLIELLILIPLRRGVKTLVRIRRKSLRTLILELRDLIRKALVLEVLALVMWKLVLASLIPPTKIWVLTPPRIISFRVWRIEGLPLVIKSISLLYLDCSLDLRKVRAVNG